MKDAVDYRVPRTPERLDFYIKFDVNHFLQFSSSNHLNFKSDAASIGELDGIAENINQDLSQPFSSA
jgi:hypothetical protein